MQHKKTATGIIFVSDFFSSPLTITILTRLHIHQSLSPLMYRKGPARGSRISPRSSARAMFLIQHLDGFRIWNFALLCIYTGCNHINMFSNMGIVNS